MAKQGKAEGYISKAVLSNFRVSPQKARLVVDLIRGQSVERALDVLSCCDKKTAPVIKKLVRSAAASAKTGSGVDVDDLIVKRIWVDAGKTIKRFMPRAHGRATPIRKRHSSITVLLDERGSI